MAPPIVPVTNPVDYLVEQRFPFHASRLDAIVSPTGFGGITIDEREALAGGVEGYRQQLLAMPEAQLRTLCDVAGSNNRDRARLTPEQVDQTRFFCQRSVVADFDHWGRLPLWTLDEGNTLVFGRCPRKVYWESIKEHRGASPFVQRYWNLRDLLTRSEKAKLLMEVVPPTVFLAFVARSGYVAPPELAEVVESRGVRIADWKTLHDEIKSRHTALEAEHSQLQQVNLALQGQVALAGARIGELEEEISGWEFDPGSPTYPEDLDVAMQAWTAVSRSRNPPANPKADLERWLRKHYPKISAEARARIAMVCNWNKRGGHRGSFR